MRCGQAVKRTGGPPRNSLVVTLRNSGAVDADPFAIMPQRRARDGSHAQACSVQGRRCCRHRCALALGSDDKAGRDWKIPREPQMLLKQS